MKLPMTFALMAVSLAAGSVIGFVLARSQRPGPQEDNHTVLAVIMESENRIVATLQKNDIAAFGSLLPDDVIDVEDDGIHGKTEWLKVIQKQKDEGYLFTDFKFENPQLLRLGPDAAIMYASERWHALDSGKISETHVYTHALYVRRSGHWVPIFYQDSNAQN